MYLHVLDFQVFQKSKILKILMAFFKMQTPKIPCKFKKSETFGAPPCFLDFVDFWILDSGSWPL